MTESTLNDGVGQITSPETEIVNKDEIKIPTETTMFPGCKFHELDDVIDLLGLHDDIEINLERKVVGKQAFLITKIPTEKIIPGPRGSLFISPSDKNPDYTVLVYFKDTDSLENLRSTIIPTDNKDFKLSLEKHQQNL